MIVDLETVVCADEEKSQSHHHVKTNPKQQEDAFDMLFSSIVFDFLEYSRHVLVH